MSSAIANGAVIADNSRLVLQGFASKLDDFPAHNSNPMQIAQYCSSAGTSVPVRSEAKTTEFVPHHRYATKIILFMILFIFFFFFLIFRYDD